MVSLKINFHYLQKYYVVAFFRFCKSLFLFINSFPETIKSDLV